MDTLKNTVSEKGNATQLNWEEVKNYDFNQPLTDYGFVTRLADENKWTKKFTEKAILE